MSRFIPFFRLTLGLVLGLVLPAARTHAADVVEKWGIFELTLSGPTNGNPYTDIELSGRFTHGDHVITVDGFYDGEGGYKIRFMPDAVGKWRYETSSNHPELQGRSGRFTVTAPSAGNHGPVGVAHTHHFAYADGTPFQPLGTTSYYWAHEGEAREKQTLAALATAPFNKIRMVVFPQNKSADAVPNFPFEGTPPLSWDTSRFNPEFFRHLEQRLGQLGAMGIEADLILFHPYGKKWGFSAMDATSDDRYVRYVVARLAAYRNVWWSLANEYDFIKVKSERDWDRMLQVVQASDPYGHLRSIHNGFDIYNHSQPWVTHASVQQGAAVRDPERAMLYRDVWRKPVVYDEVKYEGNVSRRWGQLTAEELVLRFWTGIVAGTYVSHGEVLRDPAAAGTWSSTGGELRGQSASRLAFLQKILADAPSEGISPIDKWQERRMGGKGGEHYLVYFGDAAPVEWPFVLYKSGIEDGMQFTAEVIDTWNMTITPIAGKFETKRKDRYDFVDRDGRTIPLPGLPYQAIRLRRVSEAPAQPVVDHLPDDT